jgi:hypothetical protein
MLSTKSSENTPKNISKKNLNNEELKKENERLQEEVKKLKFWKDYSIKQERRNLKHIQCCINDEYKTEFPLFIIEEVWEDIWCLDAFYEDFVKNILYYEITNKYDEWKEIKNQDTEEEYESDCVCDCDGNEC